MNVCIFLPTTNFTNNVSLFHFYSRMVYHGVVSLQHLLHEWWACNFNRSQFAIPILGDAGVSIEWPAGSDGVREGGVRWGHDGFRWRHLLEVIEKEKTYPAMWFPSCSELVAVPPLAGKDWRAPSSSWRPRFPPLLCTYRVLVYSMLLSTSIHAVLFGRCCVWTSRPAQLKSGHGLATLASQKPTPPLWLKTALFDLRYAAAV